MRYLTFYIKIKTHVIKSSMFHIFTTEPQKQEMIESLNVSMSLNKNKNESKYLF